MRANRFSLPDKRLFYFESLQLLTAEHDKQELRI